MVNFLARSKHIRVVFHLSINHFANKKLYIVFFSFQIVIFGCQNIFSFYKFLCRLRPKKKILFCIIISQHSWRKQDNYFRNINFMHSNSIGSAHVIQFSTNFKKWHRHSKRIGFFLNEIPKTTTKCYLQFKW